MKGNLAIVNANVIPMADDKRFSAILVENGDIRALGTDVEIRALAGDYARPCCPACSTATYTP